MLPVSSKCMTRSYALTKSTLFRWLRKYCQALSEELVGFSMRVASSSRHPNGNLRTDRDFNGFDCDEIFPGSKQDSAELVEVVDEVR